MVRELVRPGTRDERRDALEKGQGVEDEVAGPVAEGRSKSVEDAAVGGQGQSLGCDGWSRDVAADSLEPSAVSGPDVDPRVQREPVERMSVAL